MSKKKKKKGYKYGYSYEERVAYIKNKLMDKEFKEIVKV